MKFFLGTMASICTTSSFIPQVLKIRRSGGRDISYSMLLLFLMGVVLWFAYGALIRDGAVLAANGATMCLVAMCLVMKWKYEKSARKPSRPDVQTTEKTTAAGVSAD